MAPSTPTQGPRNTAAGGSTGTSSASAAVLHADKQKEKRRRSGKKKRNRRRSFAASADDASQLGHVPETIPERPLLLTASAGRKSSEQNGNRRREALYRLGRGVASNESLESQALLDHREQAPLQKRRQSAQGMSDRSSIQVSPHSKTPRHQTRCPSVPDGHGRSRLNRSHVPDEDDESFVDYAPLIKARRSGPSTPRDYGALGQSSRGNESGGSSRSGRDKHRTIYDRAPSPDSSGSYDVNNPPSVPSSPKPGTDMGYEDVMLLSHENKHASSSEGSSSMMTSHDVLVNIDGPSKQVVCSSPGSPTLGGSGSTSMHRRGIHPAEGDVCFPHEVMSELGEDEFCLRSSEVDTQHHHRPRRSRQKWPDLSYFEDWSVMEKEERTMEGVRSRKISEPIMIGGRLRPTKGVGWYRQDEDVNYRFCYFNENFQNTIHAHTISGLLQDGQTFKDLFIPEPPELTDSSSESDGDDDHREDHSTIRKQTLSPSSAAAHSRRHSVVLDGEDSSRSESVRGKATPTIFDHNSRQPSPSGRAATPTPTPHGGRQKPKRYGPRPVFWLDVLSPTESEMRVISKAFNIHPLTAEDILMQEEREKVELFRHYYFVSYRTFEQDTSSENYLEPVNMYFVVFNEGVISFHFSQTPHPANVRRRVRQLKDYVIPSSDWISYAIIDDITDVYAPLIQAIENEVDNIDEVILGMHDIPEEEKKVTQVRRKSRTPGLLNHVNPMRLVRPRAKENDMSYFEANGVGAVDDKVEMRSAQSLGLDSGSMLRRTGEVRKRVMGLYRLLGSKADVIKSFAKRCNEQCEAAPRNEIGLYLGDIQDHIVTMTSNLSHYENLLSRAHGNYLAHINVRMNQRAERTNDILGKLTVVGTIVLPMNIVTGLWGMNCLVPGQNNDSLTWFWSLAVALIVFGMSCYWVAKRIYGIV